MKRIQAIESINQDDAHKVSTPQITNHQTHSSIKVTRLLYQEVSCKDTQTEGIKTVGTWPPVTGTISLEKYVLDSFQA